MPETPHDGPDDGFNPIPGHVYQTDCYGPVTFRGLGTFYGETSYLFDTRYGPRSEKRERMLEIIKRPAAPAQPAEIVGLVRQLEAECDRYKAACAEWIDKTDWVQATSDHTELGLHRADVLRVRVVGLQEKLDAALARVQALEAAAPAQPAEGAAYTPSIEDLCARIKAADDAAADRDYMLDSNDCIAVLRGEWKGPMAMDKPDRASHGKAPAGAADQQLLKFYGVTTDAELIAAQARHIERLQAKLPQTPSLAPQRVREG